MPAEGLIWIRLGEHVGILVLTVDPIDSDLTSIKIVLEVVVLNIDVFGVQADLGYSCNLYCTTIVFKNLAVNGWLGAAKPEAQLVQLLDCLHDGDSHAESHV